MPTALDHLEFMLALSRVPRFGPATLSRLLPHFGSPRAIFEAPEGQLRSLAPAIADGLMATRRQVRPADLLDEARRAGCVVAAHGAPDYPALLARMPSAPLVLYVRGCPSALTDAPTVAMVGTRKASAYALRVTERLAEGLARAGACVVSGMARGVDEVAHGRALAAGGRTVAVLGCGADVCYPPESRRLKSAIEEAGAVVSPFPPGTAPLPPHFPARNRIISGLSRAVVVVEAGLRSGAMITADFAIDQERPLFAVAGSILNEASAGCNRLLAEGTATLVRGADDVLNELGMAMVAPPRPRPVLDDDEALLLAILEGDNGLSHDGWLDLEEITAASGIQANVVARALMRMELSGLVHRAAGNRYRAASGAATSGLAACVNPQATRDMSE